MQQTQVVIIGAGPTGLSLAVQLMRYNIEFVILEQKERITHLSKAIVIQARTLEIFQESALAEKAIAMGRLTTAMNMFYKGRKRMRLDLKGLGDGISHFPFALSLEQSKTERLLSDCLAEHGRTIQWNCEFTRYEAQGSIVTVYYKDIAGNEQAIRGNYLVGCDGAHSPVRHQSGQSFEGDTVPKLFYVTDITLSSPVINKDELFAFVIRKGFILFFPMEGAGHYRIIGILPDHQEHETITFETIQEDVRRQLGVPVTFEEVRWFSTYKVHSRKAGSFRKGNVFIAGDAAHIHTPAGGQGMNTGIQDAYNLAWKLAFTLKYSATDTLLESYDTERTGNAANLLRTTDRMFEAMTGANRFLNFIRIRIFPLMAAFISRNKFFNKRIFPLLSMTSIAYPDSVLTIPGTIGRVRSGQRMPYFQFADGTHMYEYILDPAFKLLFFGMKNTPVFLPVNIPLPVVSLTFEEIPRSYFRAETAFIILLRPDNHISYIGRDMQQVLAFLEKISAPNLNPSES
jgi:2-polyprenyl-6-methoxyphenol hydroxylase-like FAD-dependent oxidoreductase